ncbi:MAG: ATP-binding protein [Acidobacteriota bacterium]|nr:ATP-binding protein [Acidobacteriota bacterium]
MQLLLVVKLVGFVLGVALQVSLFVLIKRYRRIGKLERVLLVLVGCLFLWNLCNCLTLVFESLALTPMTTFLLSVGVDPLAYVALALQPSLLLHVHLIFQADKLPKPMIPRHWVWEIGAYAPLIFLPWAFAEFLQAYPVRILAPLSYAKPFAAWFVLVLMVCVLIEWRLLRANDRPRERSLYRISIAIFLTVAVLVFLAYWVFDHGSPERMDATVETVLLLWLNLPSGLLGYYIFRYRFFEVAIQRSLGFSLVGVLLLVIYLFVVRGLRDFLEDRFELPGVLVEAAMILALFALAQPLKRWLENSVRQLFSLEMARLSGMAARLEEVSRSTVEIDRLVRFTENLLRSELGLQQARLVLYSESSAAGEGEGKRRAGRDTAERFLLKQGEQTIGELQAASASGRLSTEQQAGVQLVAAQFVGALENCRLARGKIELERELAERDKWVSLGRMAAAVAHNVKNPLSSIKTIVQLMQEDGEVQSKYRSDLGLINGEIDRLSHSVGQLLTFSRPTVAGRSSLDLDPVLGRIGQMFQAESERRQVRLIMKRSAQPLPVQGNEEIFLEIFQNLVVNALEAAPAGSRITLGSAIIGADRDKRVRVRVEDEGPGIPAGDQSEMFRPFYTTKPGGTGLGLALAQRRVLDLGGEISCHSPVSKRGGARFEVTLPLIPALEEEPTCTES